MLRLVFAASLSVAPLFAQGWVDRTPANPLSGPSGRHDPAMCWDQAHGYVLMFGGLSFVNSTNDTWSWSGTAWTQRPTITQPNMNISTSAGIPLARRASAMTYHTPTGEVVMVCGGQTYTWTGSDWFLRSGGAIPSAVTTSANPINLAMGRDEARNQTVLFVGSHYFNNSGQPYVQQGSETLLWDGFSWSLRPTATHPFPAEQPSMAFDPATGRFLLCTTDATNAQSYFWDWNGTNWTQRLFAGAPTASGALATDSLHSKIVLLDGSLNPAPGHTWTIAGSTLAQLGLALEPSRRQGAGIAFDPVRNRTFLFGGINVPVNATTGSVFSLADSWEFELGNGAAYTTYGAGCAGARGVPSIAAQGTSLPHVGQTFTLQVNNLPLTGPVFLFAGVSNTTYGPTPLPLSLGFLGAPGCTALASGESLFLLTNVLGSAVWQFAVPNAPGATFYNQAFVLDPTANALGLTVSNGGQATIGF
jgi:hypothetical protein